jgi:hypothetical protein
MFDPFRRKVEAEDGKVTYTIKIGKRRCSLPYVERVLDKIFRIPVN